MCLSMSKPAHIKMISIFCTKTNQTKTPQKGRHWGIFNKKVAFRGGMKFCIIKATLSCTRILLSYCYFFFPLFWRKKIIPRNVYDWQLFETKKIPQNIFGRQRAVWCFFFEGEQGALCEVVILRQGIFQFEGGALWCQKISKKRLIFKTNFLNPLTLKLPDFKIKTRNEILSFFYFLFCLQNSKLFFWYHHINYKCFGAH